MRGHILITLISLVFLLTVGCGSQKGTISSFKIEIVPSEAFIDVDVAVWQDTDGNGTCDTYTIEPYFTEIGIKVTPITQIESLQPEDLVVVLDEIRIDYFPKYTTRQGRQSPPPLASVSYKQGISFSSQTSSVDIPIKIASQFQLSSPPLSDLRGTKFIDTYDAKITFIFKSPYTGETSEVETYVTVSFADFKSDQENCTP